MFGIYKLFEVSVKINSKNLVNQIPFLDLKSQQIKIKSKINIAIKRVLDHGKYIMGPEVFELEKKLAAFSPMSKKCYFMFKW